ncbi:MAG: hypothetical protein ACR2FO_05530 [Actinomycetota bacterium]
MKLAVELFHDHEVSQWGYSVPALSIIGTGCISRDEAQRFALEAVETLVQASERPAGPNSEVVFFDLQVTATKQAG